MRIRYLYISIYLTICWVLVSNTTRAADCSSDPKLIKVPAGEFWMGSSREERDYGYQHGSQSARQFSWYDKWELPPTKVYVTTYYIDRHLTTQREYRQFVHETGHRAPNISATDYQQQGYLVHPYDEVRKYLWKIGAEIDKVSYPDHLADHPVVLVSQNDAALYCHWRGKKYKLEYSLPDEQQWEKAARGSDGRYYPWGNILQHDHLNFNYQHDGTTPAGLFPMGKSPYGVMDMAGNVFEWTTTPFDKNRITLKGGGSWDDFGGICRSASRHGRIPAARHILFGFRCSCVD